MLPTPMLISVAFQRGGVPFPAIVEAPNMELAFEVLKEAGLRMPRTIGLAVSIVGTLVIGQAAVEYDFSFNTWIVCFNVCPYDHRSTLMQLTNF